MDAPSSSNEHLPRYSRRGLGAGALLGAAAMGFAGFAAGFFVGQGQPVEPASAGRETTPDTSRVTSPVTADQGSTSLSGRQIATGGAPSAPTASDGSYPFVFDPPVVQFGTVPPDTDMQQVVTITNVSNEPLTIGAMKPDCKCTTVEDLTGKVLRPGESLEFTAVMEGRPTPGTKDSKVKFLFHRPYAPAEVNFHSNVSRSVNAEPSTLSLIEESAGTVTVTSVDGSPFRILSAGLTDPVYADGFDSATDEPRSSYSIAYDFSGYDAASCVNASGDPMPRFWLIETDRPDAAVFDLPVRHMPCTLPETPGTRPWFLSQSRVILPDTPPLGTADFTTYLKFPRTGRAQNMITRVMSESDLFTAELVDQRDAGERRTSTVRITLVEGVTGLTTGTVRFFGRPGHSQALEVIVRATP